MPANSSKGDSAPNGPFEPGRTSLRADPAGPFRGFGGPAGPEVRSPGTGGAGREPAQSRRLAAGPPGFRDVSGGAAAKQETSRGVDERTLGKPRPPLVAGVGRQ